MLTGESEPVKKEKDGKVIAGSINGDGALRVKVTGAGADSYLNKVVNMVQSAEPLTAAGIFSLLSEEMMLAPNVHEAATIARAFIIHIGK